MAQLRRQARVPSQPPATTTTPTPPPALDVRGVRKSYGATVALDGVDLVVEPGTIVGLLGRNGAGKTSLVSVVAGLLRPDAGRVLVDGVDIAHEPRRARALIGLAPQDTGVYLPLSVRDNLRFFGGLSDLHGRERATRIEEVGAALMLDELMDRRARDLSGGERRRLHTAIAVLHRPRLVLLDEPTTGADVQTRRELLRLVTNLSREGSAVVYSTHYLQEIEELGAGVALIDHGRIVARGALDELIRQYGSSALELSFTGAVPPAANVAGSRVTGTTVRIATDDPAATAALVLGGLGAGASSLCSMEIVRPTLESVFTTLTGQRLSREVEPAA
ncbi:MAG: transporter [Actinomycetia bacterium]|nr:transporter [Actinomycetes bacterium]